MGGKTSRKTGRTLEMPPWVRAPGVRSISIIWFGNPLSPSKLEHLTERIYDVHRLEY